LKRARSISPIPPEFFDHWGRQKPAAEFEEEEEKFCDGVVVVVVV